MPIVFHPNPGSLLVCDFSGMVEPEMVKARPVVVVSPRLRHRSGLCTVVPLSTTIPTNIMPWHCKIILDAPLSAKWNRAEIWAKCDMLYTMRFERMDRFHMRVEGHRKYYDRRIDDEQLSDVRCCIHSFLCKKWGA